MILDTTIHADIFFFITSISVILLTILLIIIFAYVVKITQSVSYIVNKIKRESDNVAEDIADLREKVKEEGVKVSAFWKYVTGFFLNKAVEKFGSKFSAKSGRNKTSK